MPIRLSQVANGVSVLTLIGSIVGCVTMASPSPTRAAQASSEPPAEATYTTLSWREVAPMPIARSHLSAVMADGRIFAIGGLLRGGATSSAFDSYEPGTATWTGLPVLPVATDHSMAAASGSSVFVFGGSFAVPSTRGFRFDIPTRRWTSIAALPEPRAAGSAIAIGSSVYVIGGFDAAHQPLATAYKYEPAADSWSRIADLPTPKNRLA